MNMNIKKKETNTCYSMSKKAKRAKRTQRINHIKRKFKEFDYESAIIALFALATIVGMVTGFIYTFKKPMGPFDDAFTRFLELILSTLVGAIAGFGSIFLLFIFGACLVGIAQFISNLWG